MCIRDSATTKQITNTPAKEAAVSFAPDNRTLVYASERTGNWQLYTAKISRKEDPNFPNATLIEEEVLLPVSYTHLDVYKRQSLLLPLRRLKASSLK